MKKVGEMINIINSISNTEDHEKAVDKFLEILSESMTDSELEMFNELLIEAIDLSETYELILEENLLENYGGSVAMTAPKWIAAGGSASLLAWNKVTEMLDFNDRTIGYKKAISAWKDWEMSIHGLSRLKAIPGKNLSEIVKKRFKKELDAENLRDMQIIFEPNRNRFKYFNVMNKDMSSHNHSLQYLNKVADEYKELTGKSIGDFIINRSIKEFKGIMIDNVGKFSDDPKAKGAYMTQKLLSEFVKRAYFIIKSYKKKKK